MAKKYKECMEYMVYEVFGEPRRMYKLVAQFEKKADADMFIDIKNKQGIRKYVSFKNDEYSAI